MSDAREAWRINTMRHIKNEIVPELSHLHEKVMYSLKDTAEQLTCGVYRSIHKKNFIDLKFINGLINTYHEHLISWPQRLEGKLERIIKQVRFESDADYEIENLVTWQKNEFKRILAKCE